MRMKNIRWNRREKVEKAKAQRQRWLEKYEKQLEEVEFRKSAQDWKDGKERKKVRNRVHWLHVEIGRQKEFIELCDERLEELEKKGL